MTLSISRRNLDYYLNPNRYFLRRSTGDEKSTKNDEETMKNSLDQPEFLSHIITIAKRLRASLDLWPGPKDGSPRRMIGTWL